MKTLPRRRVLLIHAYFDAARSLSVSLSLAVGACVAAAGGGMAESFAAGAAMLAFAAMMASVCTDTMCKRIPNSLSLLLLLSAPLWWLSIVIGSDIAAMPLAGGARDVLGLVLPGQGGGALLPEIALPGPYAFLLDIALMVAIFIPLFLSFRLGMGFGGGDVKLMTAGALFYGWPLAFDFLFLTFLVGGVCSIFVILGRISARTARRLGWEGPHLAALADMREFPYAPAIGVAAVLCFAAKFGGFF